jgi:probable phosphoglycerate mutase
MLYIIRHGITAWNTERRLQGRTDVPLNAEGRRMAEEAALRYKDVHFDICFCSPLIRARETAETLLKNRGIPIHTDDRLKEMCFGELEGTKDYMSNPDSLIYPFFNDPAEYKEAPRGAESMDDLFRRTGAFLAEMVYPLLDKDRDILIVGHGAMNSSIVCQVKHLPLKDFWSAGIENCRLLRLI